MHDNFRWLFSYITALISTHHYQHYLVLLSFHEGCEQGSPSQLWCSDGRLSRSCSSENQHMSSFGGSCVGGSDWPKKEAEENKENVRLDQCFSNTSGLPIDLDGWNESVISGELKDLKMWLTVGVITCCPMSIYLFRAPDTNSWSHICPWV